LILRKIIKTVASGSHAHGHGALNSVSAEALPQTPAPLGSSQCSPSQKLDFRGSYRRREKRGREKGKTIWICPSGKIS